MRKPASREIISASVELCETEVCCLNIQQFGTNVSLPKMHKRLPDVDFESLGHRQNQNLRINPVDNAEPCVPHDKLFEFTCVMNVRDQTC